MYISLTKSIKKKLVFKIEWKAMIMILLFCTLRCHHLPSLFHIEAFQVLLDGQERSLVHGECDVSSIHSSSDSEIASPCRLNPVTNYYTTVNHVTVTLHQFMLTFGSSFNSIIQVKKNYSSLLMKCMWHQARFKNRLDTDVYHWAKLKAEATCCKTIDV